MEKEKDTLDRSSDVGAQGADDLLRQLRERFEGDDQVEDIFDGDDARDDDIDDGQDEELARRIMEMFSSAQPSAQHSPIIAAANTDEIAEAIPEQQEQPAVQEQMSENETEVEDDVVAEMPDEDSELPHTDEAADEAPLAEDIPKEESAFAALEDEVPDTPLPDDTDASEDALSDRPIDTRELPAEPDEAVEAEPEQVADTTPLQETIQQEASKEQEKAEASEEQSPSREESPAAGEEEHYAALPLSETAQTQSIVADDAEAVSDEPPYDAEEQEAEPILLRDDEILLDEFETLPGEDEVQTEEVPQVQLLHPEMPASPTPTQPKQLTPRPSPLDAALTAQRKKHQAEGGRNSAQLRAAQTLSEEDMSLLLRLGYENELCIKQDAATLQRIERENQTPPLTDRQKAHIAYGWREDEQAHVHTKDAHIRDTYRKQSSSMTGRLVVGTLLAVLVLLWDLSPLYVHMLPDRWAALAQSPTAHLLALQLLFLCAAVSGRRLLYGLRRLLRMTPEPDSVLAVLLLCNLAYDAVMCLQSTQYALLNFPTALLLLVGVIADAMDLQRERIAFSVVSANGNKIVPVKIAPPKKKVVRDGRIVKVINDEADRVHYSVERVAQLQDYFYRTNTPTPRYRVLMPMLALQMLLSLGVTGICTIKTGITPQALSVLMLALQLSVPAAGVFIYAYALLTACRRLQSQNATIVGQHTVDEMARRKQILFNDTEMLHAKSSTEILVKGIGDPKRYVRYARRLFYALGGTLAKINTSDLSEDRMDGLVEILRVYPDGVEARMDGRVRVLAGSSEFMVKNGIRVPHTNAEMLARRNDESSILYLAFGGQIRLGYEINYRIHSSFEQIAAALAQGKTMVAIRSYDPNITEEYLADSRADKKTPIRVIKPVRHRKSEVRESAAGGIVATEHVRGVAYAVRMCERIKENHVMWVGVQWITSIVGAVFAGALAWLSLIGAGTAAMAAIIVGLLSLPSLMIAGRNLWIDTAKEQPKDTGKK